MEASIPSSIICVFLLLMSDTCLAHNITKLLEKESEFSTFNQLLSETKIADQINKRSTITVLALDNGAAGGLSGGGDGSLLKSILSVHVILDYYDKEKLTKLAKANKSATLTTLYQTSGQAKHLQGFIRIGLDNGDMSFGSASKGGDMNTRLVGSVTSQPYNISVLQVSSVISVPDINATPAPERAPPPKRSKKNDTETEADSPADDTSDSSDDAEAPSPTKPKTKPKHATPPKPDDDGLVSSDSPSDSPSPTSTPSSARATASGMGTVGISMVLVSLLVAFF